MRTIAYQSDAAMERSYNNAVTQRNDAPILYTRNRPYNQVELAHQRDKTGKGASGD